MLQKRLIILSIFSVIVSFGALVPAHAQLSCETLPPPLDNPDFFNADAMAESHWDTTDFCQFREGFFGDGVSVPPQFLSGGVPPDGIPPIDDPAFTPVAETNTVQDQSPVITVEIEGTARAYPLEILTRHEIVNDVIGETPIAVTFCPLCNSAVVYDRRVDGVTHRFGVSGFLRNSDLIMWDDITKSWWQQFTGEGLVGAYTGRLLDIIPSQVVGYSAFAEQYPDGEVLVGSAAQPGRPYGDNPYAGYDSRQETPFLFDGQLDIRLAPVERVLGADFGDEQVAFSFTLLAEEQVIPYTAGDQEYVVFWQPGSVSALDDRIIDNSRDVGMAAMFNRDLDGQLLSFSVDEAGTITDNETGSTWNIFGTAVEGELSGSQLAQVNAFPHFWFAWAAFFPDTELIGSELDEDEVARFDLSPILGDPNAPITIIEYGAYGCESCKFVHQQGWVEQVMAEYPGLVNFQYYDFPAIYPEYSTMAGEIVQCVLDQGDSEIYWEVHNAFYEVARQKVSTQADLIEIAGIEGADRDAIRSCIDAGTHQQTMNYFVQRGNAVGVLGTPTFFVNDQRLFTPSPDFLRELINEEITRLGL